MNKKIVVASVETDPQLTLTEVCSVYGVTPDFIQELINFGILDLQALPSETYLFSSHYLYRIKIAHHLQDELEVNIAGAAVVLELLEEIKEMRTKMEMLEKHTHLISL